MTSEKTAIKRNKVSKPIKELQESILSTMVRKRCYFRGLDYGCGHGFDADALLFEKYDPYFNPELPNGKFDIITCTYVLNVLKNKEEMYSVIEKIKNLLKDDGWAYLTVRRDPFKSGKTIKGFQWHVFLNLPTIYKNGGFETYLLRNKDSNIKVEIK